MIMKYKRDFIRSRGENALSDNNAVADNPAAPEQRSLLSGKRNGDDKV